MNKRCCDQDFGGSHYHCGNCGQVSSMYGHSYGEDADGKIIWKCDPDAVAWHKVSGQSEPVPQVPELPRE